MFTQETLTCILNVLPELNPGSFDGTSFKSFELLELHSQTQSTVFKVSCKHVNFHKDEDNFLGIF